MQSDPLCPACTELGLLVGRDEEQRGFFACVTAGCDVVEYDREGVRHRKGAVSLPAVRALRPVRGMTASWER